jgi:bacillopeptidase F (M6 metalloprotease family)
MWLWWWAGGPVATYGAGMAGNNSKVEARRRVREAQARANEARAQRERANVDDAATFIVAVGKVTEVDAWESERLAVVREHVGAEASRRRADCRAEAGVASRGMTTPAFSFHMAHDGARAIWIRN